MAATLLVLIESVGVQARAGTNDFGVQGLIDIPSARMSRDGLLTSGYSRQELVDIYRLSYQGTPWFETSFRYSIFNPRGIDGSFDRGKDRSFEVKFRLLQEGAVLPQVAVGVKDLLGSGIWSAEYLVASKRFGPADVTLGVGWGRFAERALSDNPLRAIDESFAQRNADREGGGRFTFANYFSSEDMGAFGGVRYDLPFWNLAVLAEYNSDAYEREQSFGSIDDPSPFNFGLEWQPAPDLELGVSWQQGNQVGMRFTAGVPTKAVTPAKPPNGFSLPHGAGGPPKIPAQGDNWYARMVAAAEASGILLPSATRIDDDTLNLVYTNQQYQYEADAIRRVLLLADTYVPKDYRRVVLTGRDGRYATHSVGYGLPGRSPWAATAPEEGLTQRPVLMPPYRAERESYRTDYGYPNVGLSGNLGVRAYLFDPDHPFLYQLFARLNADVDFGGGWGLFTSWIQNIHNEFGRISRPASSVLPHVRTDVAEYLKQGETGIEQLALTKRGQLADDVYYVAFGGILEWMYSGAGAEVLYRPFGRRWGVGANLIGVQKRDFDRGFGFEDYSTVIGHVSAYWASPFYNIDVAVHAGRYLARDWGGTIEFQRRFANGWSIGAFATFTDVPFDKFGEGSFDKGLVLRVPFNALLGRNTRTAYRTIIRSIQRDGGQKLEDWGTSLWETLRSTHYDQLAPYRERMMP